MPQRIAQTAKGPIEYRLEGSGPVLMVLNGGHCSRDTRLSHERLAGQGFTVLTPSRPGYDDTPDRVGKSAQAAADALAALLDTLEIPNVDVIGISAAGPTALAFAQQHPNRIRKLSLESAVATPWAENTKRLSPILFGPTERATWAAMKLALRLMPQVMIRTMMHELSTQPIDEVMQRMSPTDLAFVRRMIETSRSGTGFINDLGHRVDDLSGIKAPILFMYSPNDKQVPPTNARRVAAEVVTCELYEVPADSHLIWIGQTANDVWQKRLAFLRA